MGKFCSQTQRIISSQFWEGDGRLNKGEKEKEFVNVDHEGRRKRREVEQTVL
jgi:hypothetical protein